MEHLFIINFYLHFSYILTHFSTEFKKNVIFVVLIATNASKKLIYFWHLDCN